MATVNECCNGGRSRTRYVWKLVWHRRRVRLLRLHLCQRLQVSNHETALRRSWRNARCTVAASGQIHCFVAGAYRGRPRWMVYYRCAVCERCLHVVASLGWVCQVHRMQQTSGFQISINELPFSSVHASYTAVAERLPLDFTCTIAVARRVAASSLFNGVFNGATNTCATWSRSASF